MMNKRDFLKGGATVIATSTAASTTLAAVPPSLGSGAGLASWRAHIGSPFEVDGHVLTLSAVTPLPSRQPGEQFSLGFAGELPAGLGDGLHLLTQQGGNPQTLYLARTPQGFRADFCRLQG